MLRSVDERMIREQLLDFTGSRSFQAFFYAVLQPMLDEWRLELCRNTTLSEGEMRGLQHAIAAVETGITRALEGANVQIPDWLAQELHV